MRNAKKNWLAMVGFMGGMMLFWWSPYPTIGLAAMIVGGIWFTIFEDMKL